MIGALRHGLIEPADFARPFEISGHPRHPTPIIRP